MLDAAATNTSDLIGNMQRAVSSAEASLPQIKDYMPLNCSIGITRFCAGFTHRQSCSSSRLTLSALVPKETQNLPGPLRDAIQARSEELSQLSDSLSHLPSAVVSCLIAGSLSMIILLLLFYCVAYGFPSCISRICQRSSTRKQVLLHLSVNLVCCLPYLALVVVQYDAIKAVDELSAWVKVEVGDIFGVGIAVMSSAVVFAALSAILLGCIRAQNIAEISRTRPSMYPLTDFTRRRTGRGAE
jgi:hypothetical protein